MFGLVMTFNQAVVENTAPFVLGREFWALSPSDERIGVLEK